MSYICPKCYGEYERLSKHWSVGSCDYPEITEYQMELLTGMVMGDGCVGTRESVPHVVVGMANERFLEWFSDELKWMGYDVHLSMTGEESYEKSKRNDHMTVNKKENFEDIYRMLTPRHPQLKNLSEWYGSEGKRFPEDLELTPTIAKMWYVSDGGLKQTSPNPTVSITSINENHRGEYLCSLFEEKGFNPIFTGKDISFTVPESKKFLDWIGYPVPGFEYKWDNITPQSQMRDKRPWRRKNTLNELYVEREMSLTEVGDELGCTATTVSNWLKKYDLPVRGHHPNP